jgi:dihydroorotase
MTTDLTRRAFLAAFPLAAAALPPSLSAPARRARAFDLVVAGGTVIDPSRGAAARMDIGISAGRIAEVAEHIPPAEALRVLDAAGKIVTPGLIDIHVHVYPGVSSVAIEPDLVGVSRGVTALIDGGSAGATTFGGFRTYVVQSARTRVYALLNISRPGMTVSNETAVLEYLDAAAASNTVAANRDVIVGIKVRMLAGPQGHDLDVMRRTREAADRAGVPVMVHIGAQTSPLPRILDFLRPGDVITHALRREGSILDANGRVYPEVREAVANGVHLDVGHGRGNLDFDVAEEVLQQGVLPTVISSDVHRGNYDGPVYDLPTTLSKFMQMGMTLEQVIERATTAPAHIFALGEPLGSLQEGASADLSVLQVVEGDHEFVDSGGKRRMGSERLAASATVLRGVVYEAGR